MCGNQPESGFIRNYGSTETLFQGALCAFVSGRSHKGDERDCVSPRLAFREMVLFSCKGVVIVLRAQVVLLLPESSVTSAFSAFHRTVTSAA